MRGFTLYRWMPIGILLIALAFPVFGQTDPKEQAKAALEIAKIKNMVMAEKPMTDLNAARKLALKDHKPLLVFVNTPAICVADSVCVAVKEYEGDALSGAIFDPAEKRISILSPDKEGKKLYLRDSMKPGIKIEDLKKKINDAKKASSKATTYEKHYVAAAGWHTHKCICGEEISHYSPNHVGSDKDHECPNCGRVNKVVDREGTRIEYREVLKLDNAAPEEEEVANSDEEQPIQFYYGASPCPNGNCPQQRTVPRTTVRVVPLVPEFRGTVQVVPTAPPATVVIPPKVTTTTVTRVTESAPVIQSTSSWSSYSTVGFASVGFASAGAIARATPIRTFFGKLFQRHKSNMARRASR